MSTPRDFERELETFRELYRLDVEFIRQNPLYDEATGQRLATEWLAHFRAITEWAIRNIIDENEEDADRDPMPSPYYPVPFYEISAFLTPEQRAEFDAINKQHAQELADKKATAIRHGARECLECKEANTPFEIGEQDPCKWSCFFCGAWNSK